MAKKSTNFVCEDCGASAPKWQGQCADCGSWNSLKEIRGPVSRAKPGGYAGESALAELKTLTAEDAQAHTRNPTRFAEFDRVLGGGLVPGSVVLLGGDPGVGKSTLLLQVAAGMPAEHRVIYVSGEESTRQIAARAYRLGVGDAPLKLLAETGVEEIIGSGQAARTAVLVVDSIQTLSVADLSAAPGSVSQLREAVAMLVRYAKQQDVALMLIGHVTKEGMLAGPRVVEHMVDTVLYFESDPGSRFSVVRAVKNRFGASNELGVFAMTSEGFKEVANPSAMFLSAEDQPKPGSIVTVAWEGSRPLLIEVQALVADSSGGQSRRLANGMDQNRLSLLLAVLHRHGGISLAGQDVFLNVVGGIRISEPAADLAAVLAAMSSFRDKALPGATLAFGELGLAGEVRPVRFGEERLQEAAKQGYSAAIVPKANKPRHAISGLTVHAVDSLEQALDIVF